MPRKIDGYKLPPGAWRAICAVEGITPDQMDWAEALNAEMDGLGIKDNKARQEFIIRRIKEESAGGKT